MYENTPFRPSSIEFAETLILYIGPISRHCHLSLCIIVHLDQGWPNNRSRSTCRSRTLGFSIEIFIGIYNKRGRRVIGISGSLIWSKTLMQLIFNPCGEFWWSPEGPVSQIHSPHLLVGAPRIFSDLLRFVQMLKREWGAGSYRTYSSLVKLQPRFLSLQWKTSLWAELQPWCLSLQWRTCPWAEHWWW